MYDYKSLLESLLKWSADVPRIGLELSRSVMKDITRDDQELFFSIPEWSERVKLISVGELESSAGQ
jgi:hypothetical protein